MPNSYKNYLIATLSFLSASSSVACVNSPCNATLKENKTNLKHPDDKLLINKYLVLVCINSIVLLIQDVTS